ncbi:hypothetical protein C5167_023305 [Papaver somniferum]|uniref:Uncharacterized protein n=1 Tax=Papaver somniferum TaxID=3469 RepID=A0A4Y7JNF4_PAPSO|nr:hypothetical protein C5167_023305 [Papaver somniferum]
MFVNLSVGDIFASLLAFMPTGWALLQISQACKPVMKALGLWSATRHGCASTMLSVEAFRFHGFWPVERSIIGMYKPFTTIIFILSSIC